MGRGKGGLKWAACGVSRTTPYYKKERESGSTKDKGKKSDISTQRISGKEPEHTTSLTASLKKRKYVSIPNKTGGKWSAEEDRHNKGANERKKKSDHDVDRKKASRETEIEKLKESPYGRHI